MHILRGPSVLFTNNTSVSPVEILGLMKPLFGRYFNFSFDLLSPARAILLGET